MANDVILLGQRLLAFVAATAAFLGERELGADLVVKASDFTKKRDVIEVGKSIDEMMLMIGEMLEFNAAAIRILQENEIGNRIIPRLVNIDAEASEIAKILYEGVNVTFAGFESATTSELFKGYSDLSSALALSEQNSKDFLEVKES